MKKNVLIVGVLFILVVTACAPQAAPTVSPEDIQHTAEAAAFTMVAQTEAAIPTSTPLPPTATASPIPSPTLTLIPTNTVDPALVTATLLPTTGPATLAPTSAPQQSSSDTTADDCNKPLTSWKGQTATFTIKNETKPEGKVVLSLFVKTPLGECGYLTDLSSGPVGSYSAGAFVDGKKNFKVFGGFNIQEGEWKIVIRNDKILAMGSCYPKC